MPSYKVKTDQGNFKVTLDSEPSSPEQLNELMQLHLSGQAADQRIVEDKAETARLKTERPIPEVTPQKTIGRSIASGISGIPGGLWNAAKTIGKAAITQPEGGFFNLGSSPEKSLERLKDVGQGAASGLSLGIYEPPPATSEEQAARRVGGTVAGSIAPFSAMTRAGQAAGLGRVGSNVIAGTATGAARPLSQGDIYGAIEGASAGAGAALLPEALTAPGKAVRAVRGTAAAAPVTAEVAAAKPLVKAGNIPNEETVGRVADSLLSKPVGKREAGEFFQGKYKELKKTASQEGGAKYDEAAKIAGDTMHQRPGLGQAMNQLVEENGALKDFLGGAPQRAVKEIKGKGLADQPITTTRQRSGTSAIQLEEGFFEKYKNYFPPTRQAAPTPIADILEQAPAPMAAPTPRVGRGITDITPEERLAAVETAAKRPIEKIVMGKSGVRGMNDRPSAERVPISETAYPEGRAGISYPSPQEKQNTSTYLAAAGYKPPPRRLAEPAAGPNIMPLELWRDITSGKLSEPHATVADMIVDRQKIRAAGRAASSTGHYNEARQLGMLEKGITADIEASSPAVSKSIKEADAFWRDEYIPRFGFRAIPTKGAGRSPEDVVNFFFRKESSKSAEAAAESLQKTIQNPADAAKLSRAWIDNIVQKSADKKTGQFSNDKFLTEYLSYPDKVREIAAGGPKAKQQLDGIAQLMQQANVEKGVQPNQLMTRVGGRATTAGLLSIGYGTVAGNPAAVAGGVVTIGAGALTRLLASPKGRETVMGAMNATGRTGRDATIWATKINALLKENGEKKSPPTEPQSMGSDILGSIVPPWAQQEYRQMKQNPEEYLKTGVRKPPPLVEDMPGTVSSLAGAMPLAFHGTPHTWAENKPDISKVGTGQGAQSYGHGLYFAENPEVAGSYAKTLGESVSVKGKHVYRAIDQTTAGDSPISSGATNLLQGSDWDLASATKKASDTFAQSKDPYFARIVDEFKQLKQSDIVRKSGSTYQVNIPDEHVAKMLDWDKPLSEQAPEIKKALETFKFRKNDDPTGEQIYRRLQESFPSKGFDLGERSMEPGQQASALLQKYGIPGIKYLDQGSRTVGKVSQNQETGKWFVSMVGQAFDTKGAAMKEAEKQVTRNFVVFDPEIVRDVKRQ